MSNILFSEKELNSNGTYPGPGNIPKLNSPITPKENFIRALKRENPLWVPCMTDQITFNPSIYPDNVARAFVVQQEPYIEKGGKDIFEIEWKYIPVAGGSMVKPGKPMLEDISEWKNTIKFPNIDSWDWQGCAENNKNYLDSDRFMCMWIFNGFFERLISFMDFENAAVALIDEDQKDDVNELFQELVDFYKSLIDKFVDYFHPDMIYFHDDWGSQRAPFFSLEVCREMLVPYLKQIVGHCHDRGVFFELHCCGKNESIVPAMVESGVDIWGGQAIVDKKYVIENYGDKLMVGVHNLNGPLPGDTSTKYTPDDMHNDFKVLLETYACYMPENPIYYMNYIPNANEHISFYEEGRKYLSRYYML